MQKVYCKKGKVFAFSFMLYAFFVLFSAHIIPGSGLGRKQRVPTLNLALEEMPNDLEEGIYACHVSFRQIANRKSQIVMFPAVMHYGPRPVHDLPLSCEIHLLDQTIAHAPESVTVEIIERIRDVRDFENTEQLRAAIQSDLARARAILGA